LNSRNTSTGDRIAFEECQHSAGRESFLTYAPPGWLSALRFDFNTDGGGATSIEDGSRSSWTIRLLAI